MICKCYRCRFRRFSQISQNIFQGAGSIDSPFYYMMIVYKERIRLIKSFLEDAIFITQQCHFEVGGVTGSKCDDYIIFLLVLHSILIYFPKDILLTGLARGWLDIWHKY